VHSTGCINQHAISKQTYKSVEYVRSGQKPLHVFLLPAGASRVDIYGDVKMNSGCHSILFPASSTELRRLFATLRARIDEQSTPVVYSGLRAVPFDEVSIHCHSPAGNHTIELSGVDQATDYVAHGVRHELEAVGYVGLALAIDAYDIASSARDEDESILGIDRAIRMLVKWQQEYVTRYGIIYEPMPNEVIFPPYRGLALFGSGYELWKSSINPRGTRLMIQALQLSWKHLTGWISVQRVGSVDVVSFTRPFGKRFDYGIPGTNDAISLTAMKELIKMKDDIDPQ
jgi:hypothetical protein